MQMSLESVRFARPLVLGFLVAFSMFWILHATIEGGKYLADQGETLPTIDFVRLKRAVELETKQRRKPEKPPPPKQPPPPKIKVAAQANPQQQPLPFNMPNLNLNASVSGGPFIGTFSPTQGITGDAELIPLVRIAPQYPRQALRDGIEGEVVLEITVSPDGSVKDARVKSAKPRGVFESAAVAAAYKGRFRPKVEDGKPVETKGTYAVKFALQD